MNKQILIAITFIAITFFRCSTSQSKSKQFENESVKFHQVGYMIDNGNYSWMVLVEALQSDIQIIKMEELLYNGTTKEIFLDKKSLSLGNNSLKSKPLIREESKWLTTAGITTKTTIFHIADKNKNIKEIYVPLEFSDKSKNTTRMILYKANPSYIIEELKMNNKKWILLSTDGDELWDSKIYQPLDSLNYYNSDEQFAIRTFLVNDFSLQFFQDSLKKLSSEECPKSNYEILEKSENYYISHWRRTDPPPF